MTNEYGEELDSNGYAPSIVEIYGGDCCYWCKRGGQLVRHEIFHGSNRRKSKELGLWVHLCPSCHMRLHGQDAQIDRSLKIIGQQRAEAYYGWTAQQFRKIFGKNYSN